MSIEAIFDELEIVTEPFALCQLRGTCDLGLGRDAHTTLHYILSGNGEISLPGRTPLQVSQGTFVLVPALISHSLRSYGPSGVPIPECKPAELNLARLMKTSECSDGSQLVALCAHVSIGLRGIADVIDLVREPLIEQIHSANTLRAPLQAMLGELASPDLGSRAMIRAIMTQCTIDLLRRRLKMPDAALRWMSALSDPSVWGALRVILDQPGEPHSVESLADSVGMSRSAFAKRFSDAYGSGPMELLRDVRMRKAGTLLANSDLPVKTIAQRVGFASRSAFTRMFEARTGQSPSAFRASQRA